ncbi:MAG: hypothetical protein ACOY3I_07820 [Verrucomicrobiota bacterium]
MSATQKMTAEEFAALFKTSAKDLPASAVKLLEGMNAEYREASREELEEYILEMAKLLRADFIVRDTQQNYEAWLKGWQENLEEAIAKGISADTVRPKYFRKSKFLRLKKDIVVSDNLFLEHELFTVIRHYLFQKYLAPYEHIYEIGCGSCQNLYMLTEMFPDKKIYGFDWVEPSKKLADLLGEKLNKPIRGGIFNMIEPPKDFSFPKNSAVITIHAMEQIGKKSEAFLDCLIKAKPELVLHHEPILEFYDENNLLDYLAKWYSQKRNYLEGYWPALQAREAKSEIEFVDAYRPYLGGIVHEASVIAWRPK